MIRIATRIAADQMHLGYGHVELGFVGEFQHHEFGVAIAQIQVGEALVTGDAMGFMDNGVAGTQLGQVT